MVRIRPLVLAIRHNFCAEISIYQIICHNNIVRKKNRKPTRFPGISQKPLEKRLRTADRSLSIEKKVAAVAIDG